MTTTIIQCRPTAETVQAIADARAAWEKSCREQGPSDAWDRDLIDSAIRAFARQGRPFSANDIRSDIPGVRKALVGRRFVAAQQAGLLDAVGFTPSTLASTKGAYVRVYAPVRQGA